VNCSIATGTMGESVLDGANGATLTNAGTLNVGVGSAQLCGLEQGAGAAATVVNTGTFNAPSDVFVGWRFENQASGTVNANSSASDCYALQACVILGLAGGEGPSAEAGTWNAGDLALMSGTYSFTNPAGVTVSYLYVGTIAGDGQTSDGDNDPLDVLLPAGAAGASL